MSLPELLSPISEVLFQPEVLREPLKLTRSYLSGGAVRNIMEGNRNIADYDVFIEFIGGAKLLPDDPLPTALLDLGFMSLSSDQYYENMMVVYRKYIQHLGRNMDVILMPGTMQEQLETFPLDSTRVCF